MIPDVSSVIRKLTKEEINFIQHEIDVNEGLWMNHPMGKTALDSGKSIIINWVTYIKDSYQLQWTFKEKFPKTWELLESVAEGKQFGKIYWHRLDPGVHAKPHVDVSNPYIWKGDGFKRYNIFLDIPTGVELIFDGLKEPIIDVSAMEYTLYDMAANQVHSVNNYSDKPFYVMIIDVLNPGVEVYDDLYYSTSPGYPGLSRIIDDLTSYKTRK